MHTCVFFFVRHDEMRKLNASENEKGEKNEKKEKNERNQSHCL